MGIIQTATNRLLAPFDHSFNAISAAMQSLGMDVTNRQNPIVGSARRSIRQNRWAAEVSAGIRQESPSTTVVDWSVDMLGDKHFDVIADILGAAKVDVDDLGVRDALERLGKMGRFFGARESGALTQVVHIDERVIELAQGVYNGNQGMLVLTSSRLFFFDKRLMGSNLEEFDLLAIGSLGQSKKLGGETINISISGRTAEIKQVAHGRSDVFIRAFKDVKAQHAGASASRSAEAFTTDSTSADVLDQIRKLAEMRELGILSDAEFNAKKAELLARL
ncbi:PH domain-containing protein [Rhodococcus sp. GB-02]